MTRRTTPGLPGYLASVAVSMAIVDIGVVVSQGLTAHPLKLVFGLFWGMFYVATLALPSAPVGVLIVHLACRRITDQRVHVAAAALVGAVAGLVWLPVLSSVDGLRRPWLLPWILALACAAGRASVVPWLPVDDDSRHDVPAR